MNYNTNKSLVFSLPGTFYSYSSSYSVSTGVFIYMALRRDSRYYYLLLLYFPRHSLQLKNSHFPKFFFNFWWQRCSSFAAALLKLLGIGIVLPYFYSFIFPSINPIATTSLQTSSWSPFPQRKGLSPLPLRQATAILSVPPLLSRRRTVSCGNSSHNSRKVKCLLG